jgi:membrane protein implicated in regulation of membrane protease activity
MEQAFLGVFLFGFLFAVVSGLLGAAHGGDGGALAGKGALPGAEAPHGKLALPGNDVPSGKLLPSHVGEPATALPRLNLTAGMAFATWFGGAGWLVLHYTGAGPLVACLAGAAAGWPAYRLVAGFYSLLHASETVRHRAQDNLEGTLARVTARAAAGGVAEIVFEHQGLRRVEGARALEGHALEKGDEVVITGYEGGLAIVHPLHEEPRRLADPTVRDAEAAPAPDRPLPDRERP